MQILSITVQFCNFFLVAYLFSVSASGAQENRAPTIQDFREQPLIYKEEVEDRNLAPKLDESLLVKRLSYLMLAIEPHELPAKLEIGRISRRVMTFHITVRVETAASEGYLDFNIPASDGKDGASTLQKLEYKERALISAIQQASVSASALSGFKAEVDPERADLLIHINLADRLQTSTGFAFDQMSRYPQRILSLRGASDLKEILNILPWTLVRLYHRRAVRPDSTVHTIEGGEIWIQYPTRTFWQESVARVALQDRPLSKQLGLGQSRSEILSRFRPPNRTPLHPLRQSLMSVRPTWSGQRPSESLLSVALSVLQADEESTAGPAGPMFSHLSNCLASEHAKTLEGRLFRSMAMFRVGVRLGALPLDPISDYFAEFNLAQEGFLAEFSLVGYEETFDQRLDDKLSIFVSQALARIDQDVPSQIARGEIKREMRTSVAEQIVEKDKSAISRSLLETALDLRVGGDTCLSKNSIISKLK